MAIESGKVGIFRVTEGIIYRLGGPLDLTTNHLAPAGKQPAPFVPLGAAHVYSRTVGADGTVTFAPVHNGYYGPVWMEEGREGAMAPVLDTDNGFMAGTNRDIEVSADGRETSADGSEVTNNDD